jgi:beta-glucosidase
MKNPRNAFLFPKSFVWGVATAATQIEGAAFEGGKGESIWDRYARTPGKIACGDTPDVACDHYHRYEEDFALLEKMGVRNYRMSIAWPRIFPTGEGAPNARGIEFYHRLFDSLERRNITPWVTMFHWDLPQALEDQGGWRTRGTVNAFARYAELIVREYGARVKNWITLNEAVCFTVNAYANGGPKAPGVKETPRIVNQICHHAILCHGHGVRAVRKWGGKDARVGLAEALHGAVPLTETKRDIEAAQAWFHAENLRFLDPIVRGSYAPAYLRACGKDRPRCRRGDFSLIGQKIDFVGLNIYTATFIRAGEDGRAMPMPWPADYPRAGLPWLRLVPQAMYWTPRFTHEVFGVKTIYVTENGCGHREPATVTGELPDLHRCEFMRSYLRELHRALQDGVPVRGYFHWSLMDNFEWSDGYGARFGLVHVDFHSQRRTPKLSARYYATVVTENRVP